MTERYVICKQSFQGFGDNVFSHEIDAIENRARWLIGNAAIPEFKGQVDSMVHHLLTNAKMREEVKKFLDGYEEYRVRVIGKEEAMDKDRRR